MTKQNLFRFTLSCIAFSLLLHSCKRINEATELGGDLIPAVDNINTFEVSFPVETYENLLTDTAKVFYTEQVALGTINDPAFGTTNSDVYFNVVPPVNMFNPFFNKDSVQGIDSVVLSLSYTNTYGDTNSVQTVSVEEIAQSSDFTDTAVFRRDRAAFTTTGGILGTKSYMPSQLNDTIRLIRKNDTTKVANVLRIPLSSSIGDRFKNFDTTNTSNGGFRNDSIFLKLFKGFAIKTTSGSGPGALSYFSLGDFAKTKLIVYFRRIQRDGKFDTTFTEFIHERNGQANLVKRTPAGEYQSYLTNGPGQDDKIYIQSTPGSFGAIKIKGVDTMQNKIIHRAELIAYRLSSASDDKLTPPGRLYLDIKSTSDSAYFFSKDLFNQGQFDLAAFGGNLRGDGTYRFALTRHVQDIVTRKVANDTLRLFAPLSVAYSVLRFSNPPAISVNNQVANGRVVVGGGNHADPALRMRLRIIYSNIK